METKEILWYENKNLSEAVTGGREGRIRFQTVEEPGKSREYVRLFAPHQRLILLGGGHISCELCRLAAWLDFEVVVADDRPEFANESRFPQASRVICGDFVPVIRELEITSYDYVAVMTRGHACDGECLEEILRGTMPAYLGMVGSKRKVALVRRSMLDQGFSEALLDRVEAPIGLAIGARTPGEIAVSILAQLIEYRNREQEKEDGLLDFTNSDPELLKFMAETKEAYVLAVVVEKSGSAPVSGGALMAVGRDGIAAGTVGGGRGEFEAALAAGKVLESGRSAMITVHMTNQEAAGEGMICGGTLKIWLEYCGPEGCGERSDQ